MSDYPICQYERVSRGGNTTRCSSMAATREARFCATHLVRTAQALAADFVADRPDATTVRDLHPLLSPDAELAELLAAGIVVSALRDAA